MPPLTKPAAGFCVLAACALHAPAQTQTPPQTVPEAHPAARDPVASDDAAAGTDGALPPMPEERAPLLREGSFIVRAIGVLQRDSARGGWVLRLDPERPGDLEREFILMPCALLEEIQRMTEAASGHRLTLEMTGEVFVYRDRNYLMPMHPPLVVDHEPVEEAPSPEAEAAPEGAGDRAEDIMRELERSAGPRTRRPEARASGDASAGEDRNNVWREGTTMVERRGRVRRLPAGTYMYVFDADAEGLADPPVILLPSQLMERLEAHERRSPERSALLLNGHVYVYQGQAYLLPTLYRVAHERTPLTP